MTKITDVVYLEKQGEIATLLIDNPPVNALSVGVRKGMVEGVKAVMADDSIKALVIACAGKTFIAGADITEFGKPPQEPGLESTFSSIENGQKPVIAAIHGTALGGGLETSLVCHFRVAVPSARFGLPEVHLGLLPGAGGTQRLPLVVGVEKAIQMIATGKQISAKDALQEGLIDEIIEGDLLTGAVAFAQKVLAEKRPLRKISDRREKVDAFKGKPEVFAEARKSFAKSKRGFEAPQLCIDAVEFAVYLPIEEGLKREKELFAKLKMGSQSAAQRYMFFAEREVTKIPDVPADTPQTTINKVGIVGSGTMGGGIAMSCANAGIPVIIAEVNQQLLDKGLAICRKNYENTAAKGRLTKEDVEKRMSLIKGTVTFDDMADVDLVIEAVYENMDLKKEIFGKLDKICKPEAILASNTSGLNIDEIAKAVSRPEAFIGLHFFSPANVMRLLEIVRGAKTSKTVIATSMAFGKRIQKVPVLVGVCQGFVGNRMLKERFRENNKLVLEGAMPQQIDKVMYDFGFPMGPFAMNDMAGLDLGWNKATSKGATVKDRLCEAGRLGLKNGAGFYDYKPGSRVPIPSPLVEKVIKDFAAENNISQRVVTDEEILLKSLYPMINEGAKILEEGIAIRPSDIDVIWVTGYGWPIYRGGPMFYADLVGVKKIYDEMVALQEKEGDIWKPAPLLEKLAKEGKGFKDFRR
ncbi:MAG: 3-hydroxyacyl-CoA dehydrogenase [Deltaproteobacteria bacterium HGW-Deltaproteobacteria-9]|nr:MAG: 3-hydroxyacyl-CoA dehydrogenase [Deltaproteobacteria bacterium HGW-Deltaproteobacteria-9]